MKHENMKNIRVIFSLNKPTVKDKDKNHLKDVESPEQKRF